MKSPLNNHVLILFKLSIYMELIREPGQVFSCLCLLFHNYVLDNLRDLFQ